MKFSATTTQPNGRATSRSAGAAVARVIAVGRIPAQSVIEEIEQKFNLRVISQHAVSDWIEQDDPCASAQHIKKAIEQILGSIESPSEQIVVVMSPFAMSSVIAVSAVREALPNKIHIVHYKYQHRDLICLDSSCLFS